MADHERRIPTLPVAVVFTRRSTRRTESTVANQVAEAEHTAQALGYRLVGPPVITDSDNVRTDRS
jgi:hypothetical protein